MSVSVVEFPSGGGRVLRGTLYRANEAPDARAAVIAGALAVPQRFYEAFANFLVGRGIAVLTFDYRGMGESRAGHARRDPASMSEWGLDIAAAVDFMRGAVRPQSLALIGHSAGGQVAGLAQNFASVDSVVFVATQSGYWRLWSGLQKVRLWLFWHLMPVATRIFGYFPSRAAGLGSENLPRGVALEWSRWGRHPRYLFGAPLDHSQYAAYGGPLLAFSLEGDQFAPRRGVEALLREYSSARVEHRHVADRSIGHFGFFRRGIGERLWSDIADALESV